MKEKWVRINTIEGYEEIRDQYWISNSDEDKVVNRDTGKKLKICINKDGYPIVGLMTIDNKVKICRVHVIKAKGFIYSPNPLSYNMVRHLNDIKTDNRLINLAFGTRSQNARDSIRNGSYNYEASARGRAIGASRGRAIGNIINAKKLSKPVICLETGMVYPSTQEAGRKLGISNSNISACCRGKRKTAKGLHWKFVNQRS